MLHAREQVQQSDGGDAQLEKEAADVCDQYRSAHRATHDGNKEQSCLALPQVEIEMLQSSNTGLLQLLYIVPRAALESVVVTYVDASPNYGSITGLHDACVGHRVSIR